MYMPIIINTKEGKVKMEITFYILIFVIGTLFGSFYTLGIHRIPKKQDIIYTHSYCPKCNHRLGFFELIPILSYIFLGGKCKHCKEKIKARYIIIELLTGTLFLVITILMNITVQNVTVTSMAELGLIALYITYIILVCGIDKEKRKIEKSVTIYGIVISILYMAYLCIVEEPNIYRYGIYLLIYSIILIFDTVTLKIHAKNTYVNEILFMITTMAIFTGEYITGSSLVLTLLVMLIYLIIYKIKNRKVKFLDKDTLNKMPVAFYLGTSNLIWLIFALFYNYVL